MDSVAVAAGQHWDLLIGSDLIYSQATGTPTHFRMNSFDTYETRCAFRELCCHPLFWPNTGRGSPDHVKRL